MVAQKILVVEDEENLLEALKYNLEKERYSVRTAVDGGEGLALAQTINPDLIILDIMLPTIDGLEICRTLRRETNTPILILSALSEEMDRVVGLEIGADDYVTKPFSMREVIARVKTLLRRSSATTPVYSIDTGPVISSGNLEIDVTNYQVSINEKLVDLTPKEFSLLQFLVTSKGRIWTRSQILDQLWEHNYIGDVRTVDVHIRWLRKKIETDPSHPKRIVTVRGMGYRFQE
jgi:two-component system OmpR family response regulator